MTVTQTASSIDLLAGLKIIDCDAHWTEPPDLWTARVPASMKDQVPVQSFVEGMTLWSINGETWASTGGNTIGHNRQKVLGTHVVQPFSAIDPSSWDVTERLAILDEMGIHAQILYPNGIGFSSNHIFAIEDVEQRLLILTIYNDYMVEVQKASNDRLFPQVILPIWDMDLTVREMTKRIDQGIRGFTLSDKPELLGLPELPEAYFDPMWDLFNESGTVPNFHIGAGLRREEVESSRQGVAFRGKAAQQPGPPTVAPPAWRWFGRQRTLAVSASLAHVSNMRIVANLCNSDLFDRYPKLKIVSAESGIGWVPFLLEDLDYQYHEMVTLPEERGLARRMPSEYFHDHLYVMYWFEQSAPAKLIEDIGVNNILVETDVPHPTCLYPDTRERLAASLAAADDHGRRRILQDNAAELYRIPLG
ncbi:amidohydrolase family protein [Pseudofrankia sp. DC12]|uniref:amidohydrolase family protein n=1 Tax=Pseudofrankia sp. DC12 TaxID=683315 RepID=UPI0005F85B6E|nr:amidohydrolase family protein [Pseudofrankia sp. DC12]